MAIETAPTSGIKEITWHLHSAVSMSKSVFSLVEQVYDFGGQRRDAEVVLANMSIETAKEWRGFFLKLNGPAGAFYFQDVKPSRYPVGAGIGNPVVASGNSGLSTNLLTEGWQVSTVDILKTGDEFSINDRIYTLTEDVNSDANGDATLPIWPRLPSTPPVATTRLKLGDECRGTFRLPEIPPWTNNLGDYQGTLTFMIEEAYNAS